MTMVNKLYPRCCLREFGRRTLVITIKVALLLMSVGVLITIGWIVYELSYFLGEKRAAVALRQRSTPGAVIGGPTAEAVPCWAVSELVHGRLYIPVTWVTMWCGSNDQQLDQETWNYVRAFRYLRELEIHGCGRHPSLFADFSVFTNLRYVLVSETCLSEKEIATLAALPRLEEAVLERKHGIDEWLPAVGRLRRLRILEIRGDLSDQAATVLANLLSLETLAVQSDRLTSSAAVILGKMRHLKYLSISGDWVDDEALRQLTLLENLKELHLVTNSISDQGVALLVRLPGLECLTLQSKNITSKSAEWLSRLKKLKYLDLSNTLIDDAGLRYLSKLSNLEVLKLQGTLITDPGIAIIFPSLGYLDLSRTSLNDAGLKHIAQSPQLRCLVLFHTQVTNASIDTLAAMPSLMYAYVTGSQIDERSVRWLQFMKTLQSRRAAKQAAVLQVHPGQRRSDDALETW